MATSAHQFKWSTGTDRDGVTQKTKCMRANDKLRSVFVYAPLGDVEHSFSFYDDETVTGINFYSRRVCVRERIGRENA